MLKFKILVAVDSRLYTCPWCRVPPGPIPDYVGVPPRPIPDYVGVPPRRIPDYVVVRDDLWIKAT